MWPWGHLAVGYLLYSPSYRLRTGDRPQALAVIFLTIGTQFPDLIDKPLAYWFGILPEGRSMAHSYLFIIPFCALLFIMFAKWHRSELGIAFTIGYLSHPIADGANAMASGEWARLTFMIWPVFPLPEYTPTGFSDHLAELKDLVVNLSIHSLTNPSGELFIVEVWLVALLILLWILDGIPPVGQTMYLLTKRAGSLRR